MPIIRFGLCGVVGLFVSEGRSDPMRSSMSMFDCRVLLKAIVLLYWPIGSINCVKHLVSCPSLLASQHLIQEHVNVLPIPHESDDTDHWVQSLENQQQYLMHCCVHFSLRWIEHTLCFDSGQLWQWWVSLYRSGHRGKKKTLIRLSMQINDWKWLQINIAYRVCIIWFLKIFLLRFPICKLANTGSWRKSERKCKAVSGIEYNLATSHLMQNQLLPCTTELQCNVAWNSCPFNTRKTTENVLVRYQVMITT